MTPPRIPRKDIAYLASLGIEADDLAARTQLDNRAWTRQAAPADRDRIRANSAAQDATRAALAPSRVNIRTRSW